MIRPPSRITAALPEEGLRINRTQLLGLLLLVTILIAITVGRYLWLLLVRGR